MVHVDKRETWRSFGSCARCPDLAIDAALNAKETAGIAAARKWLNSEKSFLVISGSVGSGKTTAATWAVMRSAMMARHVRAGDLSTLAPFGDSAGRWRALRDMRMLVIDDLGSEHPSEWWKANLDSLIDHRYGAKARTVITTNLTPLQLQEAYGLRIFDRLRHSGVFALCGTISLRGAA